MNKNKKNVYGISFPSKELHSWAKAEAKREGRSLSNFIRRLVEAERVRLEGSTEDVAKLTSEHHALPRVVESKPQPKRAVGKPKSRKSEQASFSFQAPMRTRIFPSMDPNAPFSFSRQYRTGQTKTVIPL